MLFHRCTIDWETHVINKMFAVSFDPRIFWKTASNNGVRNDQW